MHNRHRIAEAPAKTRHRLRRKRYLGHQHAGGLPLVKHMLDRLQINFGLARAGNAINQHHLTTCPGAGSIDNAKGFPLPGGKGWFRRGSKRAQLHAAHAPAPEKLDGAMLFERLQHTRYRAEFGGKLGHAQFAAAQRLEHCNLLHGVLARHKAIDSGAELYPAIVHLTHFRLLDTPMPIAPANHARHGGRGREQTHARGKRRDVALGQILRAGSAFFVEIRGAKHPDDGLHLGGVDAHPSRITCRVGERNHEADRLPAPEGHQHGATDAHRVIAVGSIGRRIGVGRIERLRGDVEYHGCEFHAHQYSKRPRTRLPQQKNRWVLNGTQRFFDASSKRYRRRPRTGKNP